MDGSTEQGGGRKKEPSPLVLLGAGVELGGVVAVLVLLGWWLDRRLGSTPWAMLGGLIVGFVGGMYNLWKTGRRFFHNSRRDTEQ